MISHRNLQVEGAHEVADDLRYAMKFIDPEQIVLSTDCGFGRQGCNRLIAFHKAISMARGANLRFICVSRTQLMQVGPSLRHRKEGNCRLKL